MPQSDDAEIRYEFDAGGRCLVIGCQGRDFERIRDAVLAAVPSAAADISSCGGLRHILIHDTTEEAPPNFLRDRIALLGCALVGFMLLAGIAILFMVIVRTGL